MNNNINEIENLKNMIMQQSMKMDVLTAKINEDNKKNNNGNNIYKNILYFISFFISIITFIFTFIKIYFTDLVEIKTRLTRIETKIEVQELKNK